MEMHKTVLCYFNKLKFNFNILNRKKVKGILINRVYLSNLIIRVCFQNRSRCLSDLTAYSRIEG